MTNFIRIEYQSMDENKEKEWNEIVAFYTGIEAISWLKKESRIEINWYWEQKAKVGELVKIIDSIFRGLTIKMENGDNRQVLAQNDIKATEITNPIVEEKVTMSDIPEESTILFSDSIAEENINSEGKEEQKSIPQKEYEEDLKELFGSKLSEYDFTTEKAEEAATRFCSDFEIRSECFRLAMTFAYSAPNEVVFIKTLGRFLNKNTALARVELRKSFEKWMNNAYPHFLEEHPGVNVFHFLNIFREENNKF